MIFWLASEGHHPSENSRPPQHDLTCIAQAIIDLNIFGVP
jgi:hypothetical protein